MVYLWNESNMYKYFTIYIWQLAGHSVCLQHL